MKDIIVLDTWSTPPESEFEESWSDKRELRHAIFDEPLSSVPRRKTLVIPADAPLGAAIEAMNVNHVGCALIVRDGKLVGIFTERDVLTKVAGRGLDFENTSVSQVMTQDPDTLPASSSIAYALRKMSEEGYRHIPLVDEDDRPFGVVAVRDIVTWMVSMFPADIHNLPPLPGFPKTIDGG
jgi:CBS domain-containing protein